MARIFFEQLPARTDAGGFVRLDGGGFVRPLGKGLASVKSERDSERNAGEFQSLPSLQHTHNTHNM